MRRYSATIGFSFGIIIVALAFVFLLSISNRSFAATSLCYSDTATGAQSIPYYLGTGGRFAVQTFTTTASGTIDAVVLDIWRSEYGADGNVTASIFPVDGSSHPTGTAIATATNNTNTLGITDPEFTCSPDTFTDAPGGERFVFDATTLADATEYATVVYNLSTRNVFWGIRQEASTDPFPDGLMSTFPVAGDWLDYPNTDQFFSIEGTFTAPPTPTPTATNTPTPTSTPPPGDVIYEVHEDLGGSGLFSTVNSDIIGVKFTPITSGIPNNVVLDFGRIAGVGSPTATFDFYTHNGNDSDPQGGTLLCSATTDSTTWPSGSYASETIDFSGSSCPTLSVGSFYWMIVDDSSSSATDYLRIAGPTVWVPAYGLWRRTAGGMDFVDDESLGFAISEASIPIPTPTPTASPTPIIATGSDIAVIEHACSDPFNLDYSSCSPGGSVSINDDTVGGYQVMQPFTVDQNLTINKIWIDVTKSGSPTAGTLGYIVKLNPATPKLYTSLLASFVIPANDVWTTGFLSSTIALSSNVNLQTGNDYGVFVLGSCGSSGGCNGTTSGYFWNYATSATAVSDAWPHSVDYNAYRSATNIGDSEAFADYDGTPTYVIQGFRLYGYSTGFGPTPTPTPIPITPEPDGTTTYSYQPDQLTKWTDGSVLTYFFSSMSDDTTFAVIRLDTDGSKLNTLATITAQPDTASSDVILLDTSSWPIGPFVMRDVTNGGDLVKHYLAESPSVRLQTDATHRCGENCFASLTSLTPTQGKSDAAEAAAIDYRLFWPGMPNQDSIVSVEYGDVFGIDLAVSLVGGDVATASTDRFVITRLGDADPIVDIAFEDIYASTLQNTWALNLTGLTVQDSAYVHLEFNTTGEQLPYMQIRNLNDLYSTSFAPGVYNYAIINQFGATIAEGESLLYVLPANKSNVATVTMPNSAHLDSTFIARFSFFMNGFCDIFRDWTWSESVVSGISFGAIPTSCGSTASVTHTMPVSTSLTLPQNDTLTVELAPYFLKYSNDLDAYAMQYSKTLSLQASCDFVCLLGGIFPSVADGTKGLLALASIAVIIVIGATAGWQAIYTAGLAGVASSIYLMNGWIDGKLIVTIGIIAGTVALFKLGRKGESFDG